MTFAGKVWKLLVGVKDGLVLLFMLLFFVGLWAAMSARPTVGTGQRGALLLALDGPVVEQPSQPSASQVLGGSRGPHEYRLRDMIQSLRSAASDNRVPAVVLDLDIFAGGGQTALAQVGEALDAVRKAGKPVLAYASAYGDDSYQLASHASEHSRASLPAVPTRSPVTPRSPRAANRSEASVYARPVSDEQPRADADANFRRALRLISALVL